jgi:hypothetical protein
VRERQAGEGHRLVGVAPGCGKLGPQQRHRRRNLRHHPAVGWDLRPLGLSLEVEDLVGVLEQALDRIQAATMKLSHGLGQDQPQAGTHHLLRKRLQPALEQHTLPSAEHLVEVALHQPGGPDGIAGGQGVADGVVDQPMTFAPGRGRPVQHGLTLGLHPGKAGAKQVREQVVVAPPAAHLVQRDQEQVRPLHPLQHRLAVGPARDRLAQLRRQPIQHRRLQQEPAQLSRLPVEHLLGQVVQHVPVAAGEGRQEPIRVGVTLERQPGQLQTGDPAFGASRQRRQAGRRQLQPCGIPQQRRRLFLGEAQVGGAQLSELAAGPQPRQRERRVGAAGHHQPQRGRQVLQQEAERLVDRLGLDQVVVVQHQHDRLGRTGQLVDHHGRDRLARTGLRALQEPGGLLGNPRGDRVQRGGDVAPEPHRVVVSLVQRQPGHRPPAASGPVGQQGRLAEPGRGADQDQLAARPLVQTLQQPRARHEPGPRPWHMQLGRQQRVALRPGSRGEGRGPLSHRYPHPQAVQRRFLPAIPL